MSTIAHFEITGPASTGRTRAAGLLDFAGALVVSMIVVPQPVIRSALMGQGATPLSIALFIAVLLLSVEVVFFAYLAFAAVTWGRSLAMYLLDLGLDTPGKPTMGEALKWALGWSCATLPAMVGIRSAFDPECGWPATWSGAPTRSTTVARQR